MSTWYTTHTVLLQLTLTNVLLALSVQVPVRMGVFSFAGVGFFGIGGYTVAIGMNRYSWSAPVALVVGVLVASAIGYLLGLLLQRLGGLYLGMATFAFDLILSVLVINGGKFTGGSQGLYGILADLSLPGVAAIVVAILIVVGLTERGGIGRRIEVLREDPELAVSLGINVARMRRLSFVASGAIGACGGGFSVLFRTTISAEDIGFPVAVLALTMIIVGGSRSWLGAVLGGIVFTWLPTLLNFVHEWQSIVYGSIVALAAIWVPGGIIGVVTDGYRKFARSHAALAVAPGSVAPVDEVAAAGRGPGSVDDAVLDGTK